MATRSAAVLVLVFLSIPLFGGTAAAVEENPDIDTAAVYEYRADPASNSLQVTITLNVTADKPNQTTAAGYYRYYFEGHGLTIPAAAQDLTITDDSGRELSYDVEYEDEWFQGITFSFRRNIFYQQTATVIISFDLVEDRRNEYSLVRVNDAYIGLEVWTDPFLEQADVSVITPPGFVNNDPYQVGEGSEQFQAEIGEGETRFVAASVDPEDYWAVLSLNRPDELVQDRLEVEGHDILIQSWPGDQAWSTEASESIEDGLPLLLDSIGLDWPLDDELTISQSFDPTLAGYGGWYDRTTQEISVGEDLDDHLMIHELSHLWFGDELFGDRWITEGLANTYAAEVVEEMGADRPEPESVTQRDSDALPLSDWSRFGRDPDTEQWAYPASWTVTDAILDEVGKETLDAVIETAFEEGISYPGDVESEKNSADADWKRYLDLLENTSGDTNGEITTLFADWVVGAADETTLEVRNERRQRYFALVERGDRWAAPVGLREAMSTWLFETAEIQMEGAEDLLDRRDDLLDVVAPVDTDLPSALEESYETATGPEMVETGELFDETEVAADQLRHSHDGLSAATGVFEQVGSIGSDHGEELDQAVEAFAEGDFDSVAERTADLDTEIEGLQQAGMIRSGIGAAAVVLSGGLLYWLVRRRRRRRVAVLSPSPSPSPTVVSDRWPKNAGSP